LEPFPESLSDAEREQLLAELQAKESDLSYRRRLLHGHIDMLRAERTVRLKQKPDEELAKLGDKRMHEKTSGEVAQSVVGARAAEAFPDLATLSDDDLDALIAKLETEENELSYERRILHGRMDILRSGGDLGHLAEILSGKPPPKD
jgi:anti-sigma-K factor RsiG